MGFGTAHHATTRLCLRMLQESRVDGASVIDVGTGSGVLAIAAARLGASAVLAVDHDPDALTSARENVDLNHVSTVVSVQQVDLSTAPDRAFDLVLANLTGATLARFAGELTRLVGSGGLLLASGITLDEGSSVAASLGQAGLIQEEQLEEDGWLAMRFARPASRS
jgi:ribosomal protein L11 methyltransferase